MGEQVADERIPGDAGTPGTHGDAGAHPGRDRLRLVSEGRVAGGYRVWVAELAAMLSDQGFPTLGIDFAPSAIKLAGASHLTGPRSANLQFEVVDICADTSGLGVFENLIDSGCFHCLNLASHPDYCRNVGAMSAMGAPFLMVCGLGGVSAAQRETLVRRALGEYFLVDEVHNGGGSEGLALLDDSSLILP